ncbi:MAG TPA: MgtC/SapB family protein [Nocardioides sp.]|uniref:MgtC/SapB family protein n=1 Tax=Nocardioides sp. TaxID=35761 RepID=UPI002E3089E5|nr:MgtC/SapB family protein [Nocardioides sp.]HEX5087969.1 MgtC/SapB family protein [Nocardioides sp.]
MVSEEIWEPIGQGWQQVGELALAFVLSSLIGLEREFRQKSAGLRTHTLVGVGAALFMLVSKYGFTDVVGDRLGADVSFDPSRVAAQVVSGIGFIGGGLIFVRRDVVSGLTTAASIWLTAAVGMAAGAGLPLLALLATAAFFVAVPGYTALFRHLPRSAHAPSGLWVEYRDGEGVLRGVLAEVTRRGFAVHHLSTHRRDDVERPTVTVRLEVSGRGDTATLAADLGDVRGVLGVTAEDVNVSRE